MPNTPIWLIDLLISFRFVSFRFVYSLLKTGPNRTLLRALGLRQFSDLTAEKAKRNYADNVSEYNTVLTSLNTDEGPAF
ncbi:hypothetical protein F3Y22_tig00113124pilonHSYRG00362 [Hibiscus syriacus]|uniref:Uncharacterized protein n=1 Tax=Hibiscus syriacus TaxID=106335 RepID=A0A6A2WQ73_HIBSY|nr:hypothetical protein F3Y22_tig00113124pilonHSYRG00362 [Hibiscus syriacus]